MEILEYSACTVPGYGYASGMENTNTNAAAKTIKILDTFDASQPTIKGTGTITRTTKSFVFVNWNGFEYKFNRDTGKVVGWVWPQICTAVRVSDIA